MRRVTDIQFEPDGTAIVSFIDAGDIRCKGAVAVRRSVRIEPTEQYAPDIERLVGRANALVNDALDDWESSEPVPDELLGPPLPGQERPFEEAAGGDDDEDAVVERNWQRIEESRAE